MNYTSDIDLFREWARAVCWGKVEAGGPRKHNVAIIFKRAVGQGRISRIEGLEAWKERYGEHLVDDQLLRPGTPRRNWKHTLVSDGFLIVRHPDWGTARRIAAAAASEITLYAE
jgi:hypothetical protein